MNELKPISIPSQSETVVDLVRTNLATLIRKEKIPEVARYYMGHHCRVFELTQFPRLIIKIWGKDGAQESLAATRCAQEALQRCRLAHCYVPAANAYPLNNDCSILLVEKVEGYNRAACQEFCQQTYEKFPTDPLLCERWRQYFIDAAILICETGECDISWKNLVFNPEKGFSFIDFEEVVEDKQRYAAIGIYSLLWLAPAESYSDICQVADRYRLDLEPWAPSLEDIKRSLAYRSSVRHWLRENGITPDRVGIFSPPLDSLSELEKLIVNKLSATLKKNLADDSEAPPIDCRVESWQPFSFGELNPSQAEDFEQALESLKQKKIICSFLKDKSLASPVYTIHF